MVARIEPGDSIWVVRAGDGSTVLFADSLASEVIGVSRVVLDVLATGTTTAH